jgi:hypothetical protein
MASRSIARNSSGRYFKAQATRMNRFVDKALAMREEIRQGKGRTTDSAPFIVYRDHARLMDVSMSMHPGTKELRKLLKNDGFIVTQVVRSGGPDQRKR